MTGYDPTTDEVFRSCRAAPDLRDGRVVAVEHEGDLARVLVKTDTGRHLEVVFTGVESLEQQRAEDMMLYALAEMEASSPLRRFVFVSSDEAEDDARLEVLARDFDCRVAG